MSRTFEAVLVGGFCGAYLGGFFGFVMAGILWAIIAAAPATGWHMMPIEDAMTLGGGVGAVLGAIWGAADLMSTMRPNS